MKIKALLYCVKAKPYITRGNSGEVYPSCVISDGIQEWHLNGKIVAECDYEVEELYCDGYCDERDGYVWYFHALPNDDFEEGEKELQKKSCLDELQINGYLQDKNGYAIHIKNLHIFDKPRELDFYSSNFDYFKKVEKAPKNMMRVWEDQESPRVLILVSPQEMCRIANKEQDVLIRRNVLKEMLK